MEEKKRIISNPNDPLRIKTAGELAQNLAEKYAWRDDRDEQLQTLENLTEFEKNVLEAAERGHKQFKDPYYVLIEVKKEKLIKNTIRCYYIPRQSCPTPFYDQIVYKCNWASGDMEFLWTIPDLLTCETFKMYAMQLDKEEKELLKFVLDFSDGTLLNMCKKLNGEIV